MHRHSNKSCRVRVALDALVEILISHKWLKMSFAFITRVFLLPFACRFSGYIFTYGAVRAQYHYKTFTALADFRMKPDSSTIESLEVKRSSECSLKCTKHSQCLSYNIEKHTTTGKTLKCELLNTDQSHQPKENLEGNSMFNYFTLKVGFLSCTSSTGSV